MSRRSWLWSALAVLPLAGCTASAAPAPGSSPVPAPPLKLVAFDSCAQLEKELRAATELSSTAETGSARLAVPDNARAADSAAPAPAYSGTNVHEVGVDEPDIVKTDGRRIVTISGGELRVVDTATRTQTGRLDLGVQAFGEPTLLLAGNRALVLADGGGGPALREDARIIRPSNGRSEVLLVDLSGAPKLISRYRGDGRIVDARQTGSVARVVISSGPTFQLPFRGVPEPENVMQDDKNTIVNTPVDSWLPDWEITTGGRTTKGQLDCEAVSRPDSFSGMTMLRLLSFDLNAAALGAGDPVAVVADGDTVYGTADSLYIANNESWRFNAAATDTNRFAPPDGTNIYRFSLPPIGKPAYVASGTVPGRLLNQYSMSEWDGHLRVATTSWKDDASAVRVLDDRGGKLVEVGSVEGLGKGERIYSVRFIGPRGYVVTFRQTDPLYSLDLSDPAQPRVTGELKISGYSAHLQPVGADRLIGIGQEANAQGVPQGVQVSLFDVSDPAAPKRLDQHVVAGGQSEAESDPHAVLWWPATNLLVMPVADAKTDGALALQVSGDKLRNVTRLASAPVSVSSSAGPMRRAVVVGDVLWSVTSAGLLATNASTLDRIAWVDLK
ncbi:beta-propeller domain-containing protein [Actinoplanes sp. LDG1-06]|uniref:Beta-propeller domain-containing protein n=1 Tax=Paractinoplanes ovalisporus TaxID=2810368 RepID=A0ABS2AAU7_9ACTN|nr:beta-propeller domain-containing protein [Actinoplanes ovalisporus]MBM2616950.1 beta-propeller domain-containing protein [Actinoplanes ovalisporus]